MWRSVTVHADLAADTVSVGVEYSLDGGVTWTSAGSISRTLTGTVSRTSGQTTLTGTGTKFLSQLRVGESVVVGADTRVVSTITSDTAATVTAAWSQTGAGATIKSAATRFVRVLALQNVRGNRFKYRLTLNTSASSASPVVRGVVVAYLPLPEPNWQWEFTVVNATSQVLLDGTTRAVDTTAEMAYLDSLFRSQQMFSFTDMDGAQWSLNGNLGCIMYDLSRQTAVPVGPTATNPLEGDVRCVILEAVESY